MTRLSLLEASSHTYLTFDTWGLRYRVTETERTCSLTSEQSETSELTRTLTVQRSIIGMKPPIWENDCSNWALCVKIKATEGRYVNILWDLFSVHFSVCNVLEFWLLKHLSLIILHETVTLIWRQHSLLWHDAALIRALSLEYQHVKTTARRNP